MVQHSSVLRDEQKSTQTTTKPKQTNIRTPPNFLLFVWLKSSVEKKPFQICSVEAATKPAECPLPVADKQGLLCLLLLLCWQGKGQAGKRHHWILNHRSAALLLFTNLWKLLMWNIKFTFLFFFFFKFEEKQQFFLALYTTNSWSPKERNESRMHYCFTSVFLVIHL